MAETLEEVAAQVMGLAGFAERVLKTLYAVTPLRPSHHQLYMDKD